MPKPELAPWLNQVHHGDALTLMDQMPAASIDLVITSPPYNLRNSSGNGLSKPGYGKWPKSKLSQGGYHNHEDNMPHPQYVAWQRRCLSRMMTLLTPQGAIFYNHKWRVQDGLLQNREEIVKDFPVRQIIIWEKNGGFNHNSGYFVPTYEVIYLIAKSEFRLRPESREYTDVWKIGQEMNNPHPAPFPVELASRIIKSTYAKVVLDPFIGSGSAAIAALSLGRNYIGIEASSQYHEMAVNRIARNGVFMRADQPELPLLAN